MKKTFNATVVYLVNEAGEICLAPKKEHIHKAGEKLAGSKQTFNGYGGKQDEGETILQTAIRELLAESTVAGKEEDLQIVARISFYWPGNETNEPDMIVYFFFLNKYEGCPVEGKREMGIPHFYSRRKIPYENMMKADELFLPLLLKGEKLTWNIWLGKKDSTTGKPVYEDKETLPTLL